MRRPGPMPLRHSSRLDGNWQVTTTPQRQHRQWTEPEWGKPKVASRRLRTKITSGRDSPVNRCTSSTQRLLAPDDEARNLSLRLSSRVDDILTGWHLIDLYTEVGKARKYYNTPASNSRRNTDRHEALPMRYRVLFALSEPKACSALGGEGKMKWT